MRAPWPKLRTESLFSPPPPPPLKVPELPFLGLVSLFPITQLRSLFGLPVPMVTTITSHSPPTSTLPSSHLCPQEIGLNITGPAICHGNVTMEPASSSEIKQIESPRAVAIVTWHYMKYELRIKNIVSLVRTHSVDINTRTRIPVLWLQNPKFSHLSPSRSFKRTFSKRFPHHDSVHVPSHAI